MSESTVAILAIGNEILLGDVVNSNTQWLAKRLRLRGASVVHVAIVRDQLEEIERELAHARTYRPRLLVTTGGLGPTDDDRTVAAVAGALGLELRENDAALTQVAFFYRELAARGRVPSAELSPSRRKMSLLPEGATPLANHVGAAPGIYLVHDGLAILLLPGVPEEMADIFDGAFAPILTELVGDGGFFEIERFARSSDESLLAPMLRLVAERHPSTYVKSRAEVFGRSPWFRVTISASAGRLEDATVRVNAAEADLRATLHDHGIELSERRPEAA